MHINVSGEHVLDGVFACDFLSTTPSLYPIIESLVHSVCVHYSQQPFSSDVLLHHLNSFKGELLSSLCSHKLDTGDLLSHLHLLTESSTLKLSSQLDQLPRIGQVVDDLHSKLSSTSFVGLKDTTDTILRKVDVMSTVRGTNRYKGDEGERCLHDALAIVLPRRDGYSIVDTQTIPHSCDMVIRRVGYPDIRIESKAYSHPVGSVGMDKFESDLTRLNNHGIFVSLYSGICGKGSFEFEFLPGIKKFAFYLSNNHFDGVMIGEIVRLIYKMDHLISPIDADAIDGVHFSHDTLDTIKTYLSDLNRKIDDLKINTKNTLRMLNELSLDVISKLLFGLNDTITYECTQCHGIFKNKTGLTLHRKKCTTKPEG